MLIDKIKKINNGNNKIRNKNILKRYNKMEISQIRIKEYSLNIHKTG
jgi:hypothetical protein